VEKVDIDFAVGLNAYETVKEIVGKCVEAENLGLDYVWIGDSPPHLYCPSVAAAVASRTKKIRIGLGLLSPLLHTPDQISGSIISLTEAYGDRFEICLGVGDRSQLSRVGVDKLAKVWDHVLKAKRKIARSLRASGVATKIWLGAQGPKMLAASKDFDGVLMNYASPSMIKWALDKVKPVARKDFDFGIYAPSYVYRKWRHQAYRLLRIASAVVALGAPGAVLDEFGFSKRLPRAMEELKAGRRIESVVRHVPSEVVDNFSIYTPSSRLRSYLTELGDLGVSHIVFGFPQNFSKMTIRDLARALFEPKPSSHRLTFSKAGPSSHCFLRMVLSG